MRYTYEEIYSNPARGIIRSRDDSRLVGMHNGEECQVVCDRKWGEFTPSVVIKTLRRYVGRATTSTFYIYSRRSTDGEILACVRGNARPVVCDPEKIITVDGHAWAEVQYRDGSKTIKTGYLLTDPNTGAMPYTKFEGYDSDLINENILFVGFIPGTQFSVGKRVALQHQDGSPYTRAEIEQDSRYTMYVYSGYSVGGVKDFNAGDVVVGIDDGVLTAVARVRHTEYTYTRVFVALQKNL